MVELVMFFRQKEHYKGELMQLYPAIDIKDGKCVRLTQGAFDQVIVYDDNPVNMALKWKACNASFIHMVDLDGALKGRGVNRDVIKETATQIDCPIQLGGGIRTLKDIEMVLDMGVYRAIIGTKAVESPQFIEEAIRQFGAEHLVIGVDAKYGKVAIAGWEQVSELKAIDLVVQMKDLGIQTIVYTDISKDGMLMGPNVEATQELSDASDIDIIASGGVTTMRDLEAIQTANIHGAIIGKALYEKRIDLREAIARFE